MTTITTTATITRRAETSRTRTASTMTTKLPTTKAAATTIMTIRATISKPITVIKNQQ